MGPTAHLLDNLCRRGPEEVGDELQLMDNISPRKERLAKEHLCKDAPDRPDIDCRGVFCKEGAAELRGTVPADAMVAAGLASRPGGHRSRSCISSALDDCHLLQVRTGPPG